MIALPGQTKSESNKAGQAEERPLLVLVGPPADKPCGILDYTQRLIPELSRFGAVMACSYDDAMEFAKVGSRESLFLVHYERSRVPSLDYLHRMSQVIGDRLFVVPHEVYWDDPFAFPMDKLSAPWPFSGMQKSLYRWRHRPWFRETALQKLGYHAHTVFPLNQGSADILKARGMRIPMQVIPHASLDPLVETIGERALGGMEFLWGLVGFITPNNDYELLLQSLLRLPTHGLILLGGERDPALVQTRKWQSRVQALGLENRVRWAGYIPEKEWPRQLTSVDGFVAPFKQRSASGSLFLAMSTRKPILAADMALTREMRSLGAPLVLLQPDGWVAAMDQVAKGQMSLPTDSYEWTYGKVAKAYWECMLTSRGLPGLD